MTGDPSAELHVFGPGRGESIVLVLRPEAGEPYILVVDAYATEPRNQARTNPVIAFQSGRFSWNNVKGICLTHAHEDHFAGLGPVARRTTKATWMWPGPIPLDSIQKHYDYIAEYTDLPGTGDRSGKWLAESIKEIAIWSKTAPDTFQCAVCRSVFGTPAPFAITTLAPDDKLAARYARQLSDNVDDCIAGKIRGAPPDIHNIPSVGIVVDTPSQRRIMFLGDMVKESWRPVLARRECRKILDQRRADVVKLPHHCSNGAIFPDLLEIICDPSRTVAITTPFCLTCPPPHEEAIDLVREHVDQLWLTARLPRAGRA